MSESDQSPSDGPGQDPTGGPDGDGEPLSSLERVFSGVLGTAASGIGAWAVFATQNQAGSAVLVLIGAAFLLMAVQGTALLRFGAGENAMELQRRRRRVRRVIEIAQTEADAGVSAGIAEAASLIEPQLMESPSFRGFLYETKIRLALVSIGGIPSKEDLDVTGIDFTVLLQSQSAGRSRLEAVDVIIRSGSRRFSSADLDRITGRLSHPPHVGVVIVTNGSLAPEVVKFNRRSADTRIAVVSWNSETDTPRLAAAIKRLLPRRESDND
jgi:hypothetical protein